jgi:hypothetical protein
LEKLNRFEWIRRVFSSDITPISDFKPIQTNGGIYKYLIGRGIAPELHKKYISSKVLKMRVNG